VTRQSWPVPLALAFASCVLAACTVLSNGSQRKHDVAMVPQTTYLHLLKNTPFFTALTREQLKWVIGHSREWKAMAGTVVGSCATGEPAQDDLWVLLDGGWQIEIGGKPHASKNSDAGKWFSATVAKQPCQLVTTERSFVMKITRHDMDEMLSMGFAFGPHLETGQAYYRSLF